jgi:chromosome segregation ATPase
MEKLESKLMAVTAECSASISAMKLEINELQTGLELRDNKIQSLESEISALKIRCKVNQEKMLENVKEIVFELYLVKGKLPNFEQSLMKTNKHFEKIKKNLHAGETKTDKNELRGRLGKKQLI